MENEIWKVESIKSGSEDDLFEAIITAQDGTKLIAQVPFMKTAQEIADTHNQLLPPHEWVCAWCECDFGEKHGKKCEVRKIIHEGREAAQHTLAHGRLPCGHPRTSLVRPLLGSPYCNDCIKSATASKA